jgi:FixJ family two-component response regulator
VNLSQAPIPVYLVDDDPDLSEALAIFLRRIGYSPVRFHSSEEFLAFDDYAEVACVVLDNHLPGLSGLQAQQEMIKRGVELPIIFMSGESGYQDIVDAVKSGAITFLEKPFSMEKFQSVLAEALEAHNEKLEKLAALNTANAKLDALTSREREIYDFGIKGYSIKRIAEELSITTSTVEFHRSNVLKKLAVNSFSELMAQEIDKRQ